MPLFAAGVFGIRCHDHGPVKEGLFNFACGHFVAVPVLLPVAGIPLESLEIREILQENGHLDSILPKYTSRKTNPGPCGGLATTAAAARQATPRVRSLLFQAGNTGRRFIPQR